MDGLRQDFAYAVRSLGAAPKFAAAVILTLALGLGANTAVFGVLHAVVLTPLPYPSADRLIRLYKFNRGGVILLELDEDSAVVEQRSFNAESMKPRSRSCPQRRRRPLLRPSDDEGIDVPLVHTPLWIQAAVDGAPVSTAAASMAW